MRCNDGGHGQDGDKVGDHPVVRNEVGGGEDDHHNNRNDTEGERVLEALENLGHLDKEVGELGFLSGSTPCHVNLEHVSKESLGNVERQTTKEDGKHENPLEVLEEGAEEGSVADTVTHDGERDVTETVEDNDQREPDFPRVEVVLVEVSVVPAHDKVVDGGKNPGGANGVVGTNV